jgi:C4-dicarboxylate-specific signal transduction histidine kinase
MCSPDSSQADLQPQQPTQRGVAGPRLLSQRPSSRRGAFLSFLSEHLELVLTAVALAVALALPLALELGTNEQELAGAALGACVVQGVVLWLMRRRYRRVRQQVIAELRGMLHDRINNHLTVVLMSVTERRDLALNQDERELLEAAIRATRAVSATLAELSTESLHRWKVHYAATLLDQASFGRNIGDQRLIKAAANRRGQATAGSRTHR